MDNRGWLERVLADPKAMWGSSLPLRVVTVTVAGGILVMVASGFLLMRQATAGVLEGKRQTSIVEASTALERMQQQLRDTDLRTSSLYERLNQLANEVDDRPGQFRVVIQGPVSDYVSPGITAASVPASLMQAVRGSDGMFVTATVIDYIDPDVADEPALAIGANLAAPGVGQYYPIYFVFPENREVATLEVLERAVLTTGAALLGGLAIISWVVARTVVRPVRRASVTAQRLASGHLDDRMPVRGTDALASLGRSMNHMATELQKQIVQLEDLSRVQQQFVSDVSHELRTPLTTVRMAGEMLYEGRDEFNPTTARSIELLHNELDRFEALLTDLLEISRFDAGASVLTLDETNLMDLVISEVNAQQAFAERMHTSISVHGDSAALADVDARRVQRILRNLMNNAIEHAEARPIEVRVAQNSEAVAITVRDHGVGFQTSQTQQVFLRFWRADPARARTVGGTGLGLAIALEDARLHHGWLSAWGRPGRGAQFRLTLPRDASIELRSSPLPVAPVEASVQRALTMRPEAR